MRKPDIVELLRINALSDKRLTADEVCVFYFGLFDNEINKSDWTRFPVVSLEELALSVVGQECTITFAGTYQCPATVYSARVEAYADKALTTIGERLFALRCAAFVLRDQLDPQFSPLVSQLATASFTQKSGCCAVDFDKGMCSICGEEINTCGHEPGKIYNGKLCYADTVGFVEACDLEFNIDPPRS